MAGPLWHEVVADGRTVQKEAVPRLPHRRDDALVAFGTNFYLANAIRQSLVDGAPHGLGSETVVIVIAALFYVYGNGVCGKGCVEACNGVGKPQKA